MNQPIITTAQEQDKQQVLSTVLLAFASDPMVRWYFPDPVSYLYSIPAIDAFGGGAINADSAYITEQMSGVALWYPPGAGPDEDRFVDYLQQTVDESILDDGFRVLEAMGEYHPEEPCWYLSVIGVDPVHQGRGLGAALMKHALKRFDEEKLPAYLESSNPRNISLYERHGFERMGEIQFGSSPVITPMFRAAKS